MRENLSLTSAKRRTPSRQDTDDAAAGRDVFNERPQAEDLLSLQAVAASEATTLPRSAVLHTNLGEIHLRLYAEECPKTVENFATHAKNGYYDNLLFHRVVKGFMIQARPRPAALLRRLGFCPCFLLAHIVPARVCARCSGAAARGSR